MTMQMDELFLSEGRLDLSEEENLIWKTVLRTGQWALTPGLSGVQRKPLVVVRDGVSDTGNNVISLSEIVENFNDNAYEYVTVPLATNLAEGDHADIARNNTGYVRKLKIVDEDGMSKLKAGFDFTEPDIKERVQRGTIPNTSVGLVYDFVRKSDAKKYPIALSHVALTHRPWIDKMEPFGIAASDDGNAEIASFEPVQESDSIWSDEESLENLKTKIAEKLSSEFKLDENFEVSDIAPGKVKVFNKASGIEWVTTYTLDGEDMMLPPINEWNLTSIKTVEAEVIEEPEGQHEREDEPEIPALVTDPVVVPDELQEAHLLRESRFSQESKSNKGVDNMSRINLSGLDLSALSDENRAVVEALQERNAELERETRAASVEDKIKTWQDELGLSAAPGFLKVARRIMLSDDGNAAGILLADDDHRSDEKVTATEIVERLVEALPKTEAGKIELSGQVELTGDQEPVPVDEGEQAPLSDRLKEAREALGKSTE